MSKRSLATVTIVLGTCLSAVWVACSLDEAPFPDETSGGNADIGPLRLVCMADSDCSADRYCDGGSCVALLANGAACKSSGAASHCASERCVDDVCCESDCTEPCKSCSEKNDLGRIDGACRLVATGTDPDDECPGSLVCAEGACRKPDGEACPNGDGDCASGHCVSGVCCDTSCSDACRTCRADQKEPGGVTGVCGPVAMGKQGNQCSSSGHVCDGKGTCKLVLGRACSDDGTSCASGNCVDGVCCDLPCAGTCVSCKQVGAEGQCLWVPGGVDDDSCNGATTCGDPVGGCSTGLKNFVPCSSAADCASGACAKVAGVDLCKQANGTYCNDGTVCCSGSCENHLCKANSDPDPVCDGNPDTN